ncbi:MAG: NAD(P)H-hydrate dehydratase [Phaeovulum sp.]|uniref:NAD(P)H-hydrate dehydratase n=1 Tax=Phaeovulum sp. TaxID=2934796 RepID=UPI002730E0A6|nr:NAD(P)H-hydrate dehydratase [Phaeovulum sp.]MDP2062866.1 NAD(P)H-hydrate dehydratase [Phaeovulum sp.]
MADLLTTAQMRATEAAAIASGTVTGLELMERAGAAVVAAIAAEWPDTAPTRAAVLCGPGNNGGDGFVVARLLQAAGWAVAVFAYAAPERMPADAEVMRARWRALGPVAAFAEFDPAAFDLVIDALFGIGMTRPMPPTPQAEALRARPPRLVAIDLPSGLDADTGSRIEPALSASLTVSFHTAKPGHYLAEGPEACGRLVLADIGLSSSPEIPLPEAAPRAARPLRLIEAPTMPLAKSARAHKYQHGHALILAGGAGKGGAARLASRAALRVGAGLVTLACPQAALAENAARLDAVMVLALADGYSLRGVLGDARLNALLLGPGLGLARARELVPVALASKRPTVLDADALTAFADEPQALFEFLHPATVLTPHPGEFARLFPDIAAKLAAREISKVDATRAAAARAGCTVLLKGADTVIAEASGVASLNAAAYGRAAPWLATAGAGDVLAGLIVGLLARGGAPMQAAETAAFLHVECARAFGPGLIAEDLPEALPGVLCSMAC